MMTATGIEMPGQRQTGIKPWEFQRLPGLICSVSLHAVNISICLGLLCEEHSNYKRSAAQSRRRKSYVDDTERTVRKAWITTKMEATSKTLTEYNLSVIDES